MGVELNVDNVTVVADAERTFNVEDLAKYGGALKDMRYPAAKYNFAIASPTRVEGSVFVFGTGRVLCVGSNDVKRAVHFTRRVLERHGCGDKKARVVLVVMSGSIAVPGADVRAALGSLGKEFRVYTNPEFVGGSLVLASKDTYTQLHPGCDVAKVTSRGPDEETVRGAVRRICEIILPKGPQAGQA